MYHCQAAHADRNATEREANCSRGVPAPGEAPALLDAFWYQAYRCWGRVAESAGLWAVIRRHVECMQGFAPARFAQLQAEFPGFLVEAEAVQVERCAESRNRLSAARHRRALHLLANHPQLSVFAGAAAAAIDSLPHRLWPKVRELEKDHRRRFDEIVNGLLLVQPADPGIVWEAFGAMLETAVEEQTFDDQHKDSVEMCKLLCPYAEVLDRRIFPNFPRAIPADAAAPRDRLLILHGFHLLMSANGSVAERCRHLPYYKELDKVLKDGE